MKLVLAAIERPPVERAKEGKEKESALNAEAERTHEGRIKGSLYLNIISPINTFAN